MNKIDIKKIVFIRTGTRIKKIKTLVLFRFVQRGNKKIYLSKRERGETILFLVPGEQAIYERT